MTRTVAIGIQDFGDLIRKNYFYIDKTSFIKEWWESGDSVTLIIRPRRFGKTLNMKLSDYLYRYYGKKVIILLDEYDTPMQEDYVDGFWIELVGFTRSMFNSALKRIHGLRELL